MSIDRRPDVVAALPALLRYARSLTRDRTAAEDLVHDALVSALSHLSSLDGARPVRPWLFAIVHNRFVSDVRQDGARRRRLDAIDAAPLTTGPAQEEVVALHQVDAAMAALPVEQRAVLHLIAVEGLTYQQAADAIGVPVGTVMSRLSRARRRLRLAQDEPAVPVGRLRLVGRHREEER